MFDEKDPEVKKQFWEWMKEIIPFGRISNYVKIVDDDRIRIYTNYHVFSIIVKKTYLGCQASTRKPRAGEDWTRGNDLPDGKFTRETWEKIKNAIIKYELVKLSPVKEPKGEEEKAT